MEHIFLEDIILDKENLIKYNIIKKIEESGLLEVSSSYLSAELGISLRTVYNLIDQINKDFLSIKNRPFFTIARGKKIQVNETVISSKLFRSFWFKQSSIYNFFYSISFTKTYDFDSFCEDNYVTHSTMLRRINKFKPIFKRFNIKFSSTKYKLVGNEENIRSFIYHFFWLGSDGIFWPFNCIDEIPIINFITKNPALNQFLFNEIILKQISFWMAICILRVSIGELILENEIVESLLQENRYFQAINYQFTFESLPNFNLEDLRFVFLMITCKPIFSRQSLFANYLNDYYQVKIPEIYSFCSEYKKYILTNSNIAITDFSPYELVNFISVTLGVYLQGIPFISLKPFQTTTYDKALKLSTDFLEMYIEKNPNFILKDKKELLSQIYSQMLILSFGPEIFSIPIKIGLIWEIERAPLDQLIHFLRLSSGVEITELNIHSNKNAYNLIISTSYLEIPRNVKLYVWQQATMFHNIINILSILISLN
ncbi:helix-turn-helix domain-containing protein [Enterococcus sp. LJL99]